MSGRCQHGVKLPKGVEGVKKPIKTNMKGTTTTIKGLCVEFVRCYIAGWESKILDCCESKISDRLKLISDADLVDLLADNSDLFDAALELALMISIILSGSLSLVIAMSLSSSSSAAIFL